MTIATRQWLFNGFKVSVYTLLVINIFLYLRHGTLNEALDSLGWVLLLGVFEWETRALAAPYVSGFEKAGLWALQIIGYGMAINAARVYFISAEWLDFANAVLWLLVCATIFYDVFVPGEFGTHEWRIRNAVKIGLYVALGGIAVWWGLTSDWLDFYDALLWILCFFVIELNIFKHEVELEHAHHPDETSGAAQPQD